MPKLKKIPDQCHSIEEIRSESKDESSDVGRILRKRKVNLNRLASSVSCPEVCQFQHCGVQLANDDTLEVSYVTLILFYKQHMIKKDYLVRKSLLINRCL